MFYDNLQKDLRKTFKYYKEQERKHMREKLKDFKKMNQEEEKIYKFVKIKSGKLA